MLVEFQCKVSGGKCLEKSVLRKITAADLISSRINYSILQ